jgi:hypothetical protein
MKNFFIYLISFILFGACSQGNKQNFKHNAICSTIEVDIDQISSDTSNMDFITDSIELIPLETNDTALISNILKATICGSDIFIHDAKHKLFVFNKEGKFKYVIDRLGLGPGEYTQIQDFCINGNYIEILDVNQRKVHRYNRLDGSFVKTMKLNSFVYGLFPISQNRYLGELPMKLGNDGFGIYLMDSLFNEISNLMPYKSEYPIYGQTIGAISEIGNNNYGIFSQVENSIFHFNGDTLIHKFIFNFKGKRTLQKFKGRATTDLSEDELFELPHILAYKETETFVFLWVSIEKTPRVVLMNKETTEIKVFGGMWFNRTPIGIVIQSDTKNLLISYIPNDWLIGTQTKPEIHKNLSSDYLKIVNQAQPDDNPVLEIIHLKH